jgi:glycosyltransferase involved in cell wall biosynthesis
MNTNQDNILISVVIPVYNSGAMLDELTRMVIQSMDRTEYGLEIIFVDDHSEAATWEKLEQLKKLYPETIRIIRLAKNFGQNNATLCGIDHAKGDWVVTIDDDLQFDPKHIPLLIQSANDHASDVVYGVFPRSKSFSLRTLGRNFLFFMLKKLENNANLGSSFRLISKHIVEKINFHNQDHLFINQIITWYTSDITYVTVEKSDRKNGRSGYSLFKLFCIGLKLIFYYTSIPIRLIIYFSFLTSLVSFGFAAYYFIQKITVGTMVGYSSVIVSIFAGTSVIMAGVGVLGIYVNRIYNTRIKKPNYSIKRSE